MLSGVRLSFDEVGYYAYSGIMTKATVGEDALSRKTMVASKYLQNIKYPKEKLYPLEIPEWEWDKITKGSVSGFPLSPTKKNVVWEIVDRLPKSTHFLPVLETTEWKWDKITKGFISGFPLSPTKKNVVWEIVEQLPKSAHFLPTDGKSNRIIHVLEDLLRSCVINFGIKWERYLPLAKFAYNNSYHASCNTPNSYPSSE
ncbi:Retrotransposable element Tf2 [Gossypium australe]|uniref:Retrotransposable element Tf2 n=1 Tax=Gossypium australe TaxID=47621 RepID=A0A5B6UXA9_9ROSI|nr:Retrotransposable element Tf2 [Gossypium australe]